MPKILEDNYILRLSNNNRELCGRLWSEEEWNYEDNMEIVNAEVSDEVHSNDEVRIMGK